MKMTKKKKKITTEFKHIITEEISRLHLEHKEIWTKTGTKKAMTTSSALIISILRKFGK
jgi:hypothetical protein